MINEVQLQEILKLMEKTDADYFNLLKSFYFSSKLA